MLVLGLTALFISRFKSNFLENGQFWGKLAVIPALFIGSLFVYNLYIICHGSTHAPVL